MLLFLHGPVRPFEVSIQRLNICKGDRLIQNEANGGKTLPHVSVQQTLSILLVLASLQT